MASRPRCVTWRAPLNEGRNRPTAPPPESPVIHTNRLTKTTRLCPMLFRDYPNPQQIAPILSHTDTFGAPSTASTEV
jgi:hypothetical protein